MKTQELIQSLRCIKAGGFITDCVMTVKNRRFKVVAIDPSGTLLVLSTGELKTADTEAIGIPDVKGLHTQLTKMARDADIAFTQETIIIKDENVTLKYLTKDPYFVSSFVEDTDGATIAELTENLHAISVPFYVIDKYKKICDVTTATTVTLEVDTQGKVFISAGTENTNGYRIDTGIRSRHNSGTNIIVPKKVFSAIMCCVTSVDILPVFPNNDPKDPSLIIQFLDTAWEISAQTPEI